jgi:hypothetical protein
MRRYELDGAPEILWVTEPYRLRENQDGMMRKSANETEPPLVMPAVHVPEVSTPLEQKL